MTQREIKRLTAIATDFGNGSHLVTPVEWRGLKIYAVVKDEWDQVREICERAKVKVVQVTVDDRGV